MPGHDTTNTAGLVQGGLLAACLDDVMGPAVFSLGREGFFANGIVIPLFLRWLLPIIEDKNHMEEGLRASSVEWVSMRLPNIAKGPEKPLRLSVDGRGLGLSVAAASTALFLLQQVTSSEWIRSAPSISS